MNRPVGKTLRRAKRKLESLRSRGARTRSIERLSARITGLEADYERRLAAWRVPTSGTDRKVET